MNLKYLFVFALLIACTLAYRERSDSKRFYRKDQEQAVAKSSHSDTSEVDDNVNAEQYPEDPKERKHVRKWRKRFHSRRRGDENKTPDGPNHEGNEEHRHRGWHRRVNRVENEHSDHSDHEKDGENVERRHHHNCRWQNRKNKNQGEQTEDSNHAQERTEEENDENNHEKHYGWHRRGNKHGNEDSVREYDGGDENDDVNRGKHHHRHRPHHHHHHRHHHHPHHHNCTTTPAPTTTTTSTTTTATSLEGISTTSLNDNQFDIRRANFDDNNRVDGDE